MSVSTAELFQLGKQFFFQKKYAQAEQYLLKALQKGTRYADLYHMMGVIYHNDGKFSNAIESFTKAIAINPNYTEATLHLAILYNDLGEYPEAKALYQKVHQKVGKGVTDMDPMIKGRIANLHASLADTYRGVGKYQAAIHEYQLALGLCPQYKDIRTRLGITYRDNQQLQESLKTLQETVKQSPQYLQAQVELGLTYYTLGKVADAKKWWQGVLKKNPQHTMAATFLNLCQKNGATPRKTKTGKKKP